MTTAEQAPAGVIPALVTLFDDAGALDPGATASHARRLVEAGIGSVLVAGTSGEGAWLDADERARILVEVRGALPSGVAVLAGVAEPSGAAAAAEARRALDLGATGVVCRPSAAEPVEEFYGEVAEATADGALLGYHLPMSGSADIPVDEIAKLPIDGIKDASGDANRMARTLVDGAKPLYVGAGLAGMARAAGAAGAILALANLHPQLCVAAWQGEAGRLPELLRAHVDASRDFPRGLKALMADAFGTSARCRWPPPG